jgi:hypothetical protein
MSTSTSLIFAALLNKATDSAGSEVTVSLLNQPPDCELGEPRADQVTHGSSKVTSQTLTSDVGGTSHLGSEAPRQCFVQQCRVAVSKLGLHTDPDIYLPAVLELATVTKQIATKSAPCGGLEGRKNGPLTNAFSKRGRASTERALDSDVVAGAASEELELAIALRCIWAGDESLWASDEGHRRKATLDLPAALALAQAFNAFPDIDEMELWLYDARDRWGNSHLMMRQYPTFHEYAVAAAGSCFNRDLVVPGASLVDGGFHEEHDDEYSCGLPSGVSSLMVDDERVYLRGFR